VKQAGSISSSAIASILKIMLGNVLENVFGGVLGSLQLSRLGVLH